MHIRRALAACLLALGAVVAVSLNATSASAAVPCPSGTSGPYGGGLQLGTVTYWCDKEIDGPGSAGISVKWGFDYNPTTNHLRAFADVLPFQTYFTISDTPLNLGDRNGVLKSLTLPHADDAGFVETDPIACHKTASAFYLANLHLTVIWPNGQHGFPQTGEIGQSSSVLCRG
ncbi:hypothetical protein Raf01_42040 [Rugosimonospora africana]|uniref:Secreted protein n=1 Tax=Rugosimonospora africana TaxID=556532 RepID=A0A8J3VRE5_9ACTN|nr:hypothetical protein Raf01_42040 [Rugosimonospora africana]